LRSIQGGQEDCIMERAAWNNDSPWVHDVAAKILAKSQPTHPVLHTHAQQSQVLEFRRTARWPMHSSSKSQCQPSDSTLARLYSIHSSQGRVDWFWKIFVCCHGVWQQFRFFGIHKF
jgi:hypothetical protein